MNAIVKWVSISVLSIGAFILFIGILIIAFNWFFGYAYLGVILALVGIGIIIYAVVRRPTTRIESHLR